MRSKQLGKYGPQVPVICLGAWPLGGGMGVLPDKQVIDTVHAALDHGVTFIDTAEGYRTSESVLGKALVGRREKVFLATKLSGDHSLEHMNRAIENSLRALGTDYIDLYQLHGPKPEYPIEQTMGGLLRLKEQGKIRYIGVSNETPWGTMRFLRLAEQRGWPRLVSIQNPYNLLNRSFEVGLAEIAHRESVGLLAYSPLAFGVLSGKYLGRQQPTGARLTLFERFTRYNNEEGVRATERYVQLARDHGLSSSQMALAYVNSRPFLTSNIVGAQHGPCCAKISPASM